MSLELSFARPYPCLGVVCGAGRECRLDGAGSAVCQCRRRCPRSRGRGHARAVCGTDGRRYASHCHLHRAACLQRRHVAVDHDTPCTGPPRPAALADSSGPAAADAESEAAPADLAPPPPPPLVLAKQAEPLGEDDQQLNAVPEGPPRADCSQQQYDVMKDNLLLYSHAKLTSDDNRTPGREYLVTAMFTHYDSNGDGALMQEELDKAGRSDEAGLDASGDSGGCQLAHMLAFDDADGDGRLSLSEFYAAFSKLYSVSVVSLDKAVQVRRLRARVGDSVEVRCDVTGAPPPPIVWRRHGADLAQLPAGAADDLRVFPDGSLFLPRVQLVHAGNYTCHAQRNEDVVQTHVLTVHTTPRVKVTPRIQSKRPGEEATMFCHVIGEPFPKVEWLKNDEPLRLTQRKYELVGNGTEVRVRRLAYADTGAYSCSARSAAGAATDLSSLVVQDDPAPTSPKEERRFFAFHDFGISVYEPTACRLYHHIRGSDIIPGTQRQLVCGSSGTACSWGQAINVANRYVYVAQPRNDRVLVISKIQMVVVDVVTTDKMPVELHYVPHLDQVWVLNWRSERDRGVKTVQVIRDAAQKRKHHTVHPEPIDGQFDLVSGLFIPPIQDVEHEFRHGYVSHAGRRGLLKLELASLRYLRAVDLSERSCLPRHLQFSSLFGLVVVECEEPATGQPAGQLVLDAVTDAVVSQRPSLLGRPHLSPDSRTLVTLHRARDGVTLVVQRVADGDLRFSFDVKTTLNISDVAFYPSRTTHGYDLYASASDKEDVLFLDLSSGKVEVITGVGAAMPAQLAEWGAPNRPIAAPGVFGRYLATAAADALFVLNGATRTVNCEVSRVALPRALAWVSMRLQ
ncbi:follistatin-related protein 5-like [Schistocerca nitens]|uniref:follistatin-related protein 5-like n=1 Tax=Schistocerca nitens TaxID=7011 RepID=UPI002119867A|nr:follistatin-related protein 5-like [Schistocerca nitens]